MKDNDGGEENVHCTTCRIRFIIAKEGLLNREVELIPSGKKDSDKKGSKFFDEGKRV